MKLGDLFEIGKRVYEGEEVEGFKINRRDPQTIEYIRGVSPPRDDSPYGAGGKKDTINLEKKFIDCGIISCNPDYYKCTAKSRRKYIEEDVYIALIRLSGEVPPAKGLKSLEEVKEKRRQKEKLREIIERESKEEKGKHEYAYNVWMMKMEYNDEAEKSGIKTIKTKGEFENLLKSIYEVTSRKGVKYLKNRVYRD
jgi:hypothetical protein